MMDLLQFLSSAELSQTLQEAASAASDAVPSDTAQEGGALGMLGLNWKLFLGQLFNFGIILLILWKWVFTPLSKTLEARTKKIKKSLDDAEKVKAETAQLRAYKAEVVKQAKQEYENILTQAEKTAQLQREEILAQTRQQTEKLLKEAEQQAEVNKQNIMKQAQDQVAELVVLATEKVIKEKLDSQKDRQLVSEAIKSIT
ncbi:MAG: F0F1 ATP synthase subunit B [Candidatus Doudnabacteria bacterium]|nr:F0F1 ATP synthase subunit B [Candidatus Doudnabacteria bacterium]